MRMIMVFAVISIVLAVACQGNSLTSIYSENTSVVESPDLNNVPDSKQAAGIIELDNTCEDMVASDIYSENKSAIVWPALIYNADYATRYSVVDYADIAPDNAGCAYAVYNIPNFRAKNIEVYLQRISPDGKRLWGKKGLLLAVTGTLGLSSLHVFADKDNNVIATWGADAGCSNVARVSAQSKVLWRKNIEGYGFTDDGQGGLIYQTYNSPLSIGRIDNNGKLLWEKEGTGWGIVGDGSGGAYILSRDFVIHKIKPDGSVQQNTDDDFAYSQNDSFYSVGTYSGKEKYNPTTGWALCSDSFGGALAVCKLPDNRLGFERYVRVYVFHIDKDGHQLWVDNHKPLCLQTKADSEGCVAIASDNAGGAYVFWRDQTQVTNVQRVGSDGKLLWLKQISESKSSDFESCNAISDGNGGAIYSWCQPKEGWCLRERRINRDGVVGPEILISTGCLNLDRVITKADGTGGSLYAWGKGKAQWSIKSSWVQRVAEGKLAWGENGIQLDDWNK